METIEPVGTPEVLSGVRIRQKTNAGHMHVIVVVDPKTERELEVFAQVGKAGWVPGSNMEAVCRMISLYLRIGGTLENVIDQLKQIGSSAEEVVLTKDGHVTSLGDGLSKALQRYMDAKVKYGLHTLLLENILEKDEQEEQSGSR